jgi:DNA polymerase III subunit delta
MPLTPETVLQDLKNNKYAPVYFLHGDEPYYIDLITGYIEKNALDESARGFNQMVIYGQDANLNTILANAKRFPMMSDRQVVIVKEAQEISDLGKEEPTKFLEAYLKNPLTSTILVFAHKHKKLGGKKSFLDVVDKFSVNVESKKFYDNKLPDWITNYVSSKGHSIQPRASVLLSENIGNNLERLANEIDKLVINFSSKTEITTELIHKYVGISKEYNVFELQKALQKRDVLKANQIVFYFEANTKANPVIPIIASLFTFFTKLLIVHREANKSDANIASVLKVNPYFAKDYLEASRNYSLPKVIQIIQFVHTADLQSKGIEGGSISEGEILKELVFKILH